MQLEAVYLEALLYHSSAWQFFRLLAHASGQFFPSCTEDIFSTMWKVEKWKISICKCKIFWYFMCIYFCNLVGANDQSKLIDIIVTYRLSEKQFWSNLLHPNGKKQIHIKCQKKSYLEVNILSHFVFSHSRRNAFCYWNLQLLHLPKTYFCLIRSWTGKFMVHKIRFLWERKNPFSIPRDLWRIPLIVGWVKINYIVIKKNEAAIH